MTDTLIWAATIAVVAFFAMLTIVACVGFWVYTKELELKSKKGEVK